MGRGGDGSLARRGRVRHVLGVGYWTYRLIGTGLDTSRWAWRVT